MQVIAFMNMKGGVGKTTLAVNVAYALAAQYGKQVLIVDGDPQFNATQCLVADDVYLKHINDAKKGTIRDIFIPRRAGPVSTTIGAAKNVSKAKMSLADCTIEIYSGGAGKAGRLDLLPSTLSVVEAETSPRQTEARLKAYLKEKASHYDCVIIDCPPTISFFTQAAILASDKYIVPIKPDPLSVVGLPLLEHYIEDCTTDAGTKLEQIGLVFTMVRSPAPHAMRFVMDDLRRQRKAAVFAPILNQATAVAESVDAHQPIIKFRKTSAKIKMQVLDITKEFVRRTGV